MRIWIMCIMGRVQVSDGVDTNGNPDTTIDHFLDVVITVTNVDEAGVVTFSESNIRVGSALTATLTDPDGGVTGEMWQWARSSDKTTWTTITGATSGSYTPVLDDADNYLRATVSYTDAGGFWQKCSGCDCQYGSGTADCWTRYYFSRGEHPL